jgi:tRNA A37 methylthiotransferase MiaB
LAQLLRELSELPGLRWLRILYAYPSYFDDELVAEIANNPKVRRQLSMASSSSSSSSGSSSSSSGSIAASQHQ